MAWRWLTFLFASAVMVHASNLVPTTLELWPHGPPGAAPSAPAETDATTPADRIVAGRRVERRTHTRPSLTLYRSTGPQASSATILVCPGGAYRILAIDLEGREVCAWLNSIGINAALLKYRVPGITPAHYKLASDEDPQNSAQGKYPEALQDAQRALGVLRAKAQALQLDPHRIGILGFSAGGHLSALMSGQSLARSYPLEDDADRVSCRPDATLLIYPAYLARKSGVLADELRGAKAGFPPTFLTMAEDDPLWVGNALYYYLALEGAAVPAELHLYPSGGHGYGLRPTNEAATTWPRRAEEWLRSLGWIGPLTQ
ncbi:MAG TPA: alpha/beta hydrolase [Opitutaceae bacterium]|jgi:acetyl esterase/lipase